MDYYDPTENEGFDEQILQAIQEMWTWRDDYNFSGRKVLDIKGERSNKTTKRPQPATGISWDKRRGKWKVAVTYYIGGEKKNYTNGMFEDTDEGVAAALIALQEAVDYLIDQGLKSPEDRMKYVGRY